MLNKRQQQAINTKQHITISTMALINEKDYDAISIKDICDKSEISVGTFYHHFDSKDAVLENTAHLFDLGLENKIGSKMTDHPLDDIKYIIKHKLKYTQLSGYKGIGVLYRYNLTSASTYFSNHNRYVSKSIKKKVMECQESSVFRKDMTADEIRNWILRIVRGVIYDWCLSCGSYTLVDQGLQDLAIVWDYLQDG